MSFSITGFRFPPMGRELCIVLSSRQHAVEAFNFPSMHHG
jgi:hypothetical protein